MAELVPVPLPLLLKRAFLEYEREEKIFDLDKSKFFRGMSGLDFSVNFHGHRAFTPLGPAAGPHDQLVQNIVLSWLGGSRIIELKTVQILDELKIPRPCIDIANVGYNVEWSQELKLEQSLREYVGAAMFIEILRASKLLGDDLPEGFYDTILDMSVGYNLEGIRSPRVRGWMESMKNAAAVIDELRVGLPASYRDLPFPTRISDTLTLSTFHGCPAGEIEGIVSFLLTEMDIHVCVKLNPTLLGKAEVEHLLHDVLGYHDILVTQEAFDKDLQFDEALDMIPRLDRLARKHGKRLAVKFSNTLVVKNHRTFFTDEVMYMSGAPLHVITLNLVKKFREHMGASIPISFSAGMDAHNIASCVAMNFVPVTTCTDLLRPGGYSRLVRYMENLGAKMRESGATNIAQFVIAQAGMPVLQSVDEAGLRNTPRLVAEATANPRYRWERNKGVPRKIGSKLWLYDCISCDKCVPVCPNDANFTYDSPGAEIHYDNFELTDAGARRVPGGTLKLAKAKQWANYADACNDCGNCDVFCPEDGGPYVEKPRFFGSLETYRKYAGRNGFFMAFEDGRKTVYGTIAGKSYRLVLDSDRAWFDDGIAEVEVTGISFGLSRLINTDKLKLVPPYIVDMLPFWQLKLLAESIGDPKHPNFANVADL